MGRQLKMDTVKYLKAEMNNVVMEKSKDIGSLCTEEKKQAIEAAKWVAGELRVITKDVQQVRKQLRYVHNEMQDFHAEHNRFLKRYRGEKGCKTSEYNR